MSQHERVTFTQGREVLEHAIRFLRMVDDALEDLRDQQQSERVTLLLNSVTKEQRALTGSVERYLDDVADKVLDTYAQYTVELPVRVEPSEEPLTALGLIQWLVRLNAHLYEMFAELARSAPTSEIGEVFDGLAKQVQGHDRRLSKEYQRFEDL
jgi:hypothetical protein